MKNNVLLILLLITSTAVFAQGNYKPAISRIEQLNKEYCSGLFSTAEGTYFDLSDDNNEAIGASSYLNILDWLQGRVAGLQVYTVRNTRIPFLRNSPAAIYVDEMRVDAGYLNMLPVNDIAMIKIMRTPFVGAWGANSTIAIYTKRGEAGEEEEEEIS